MMTDIWYEFDTWQDGFDETDANADVHFTLEDGTRWCAAFYTYRNLQSLAEKNRQSGECLSGAYFCADKPIFIERLRKDLIVSVLEEIIRHETDLFAVFTPVWE